MSGIPGKLSRHVLDMKFMRKTKDLFNKGKVEKGHREHFASDSQLNSSKVSNEIKSEPSASTSTPEGPLVVEELWSYNQCEHYIFGRQSFGGFNPVVENNVKKGIWKPFYLDEARNVEDSDEDDDLKKQSDVDVSDEEMAKTFGSLVGTLAKRFKKRFKKDDSKSKSNLNERPDFDNRKNKKPSKWNKKFQNNKKNPSQHQKGNKNWNKKRQRESTGSEAHYGKQDGDGGRHEDPRQQKSTKRRGYSNDNDDNNVPPQKKRKFMKPSDD